MYCCMKNGDLWDAGRVFRYCFSKVQSVGELFAGAVSGENEAVDGNGGSGTGSLRIIFRDVYRMPGTGYRGDAGQYSYFARRISFRHGLGWAILGMAAGKLCGSLLYFATEFYRTVQ